VGEFSDIYAGRTVLVTGHTGFKGSWLSIWLHELGARVIGYALAPPSPGAFEASRLAGRIVDVRGDVRDLAVLRRAVETHRPSIVFHLAAQPIVLRSLQAPAETFDVNVAGTINVLEALRGAPGVEALVCVTSDKCYERRDWVWGFRENDPLGGDDPYSASKAMAELAITSYRRSFFSGAPAGRAVAVASVRAGNIVGGGDFAEYRLVPDCMRALMAGQPIVVRSPASIRPWQHVLEPLSGYLWLGAMLIQHGAAFAEAWNFGPGERQGITTLAIAERLVALWGAGSVSTAEQLAAAAALETQRLGVSWDKAAARLGWQPVYSWHEALAETVAWFRAYERALALPPDDTMYQVCAQHIRAYVARARELGLAWAVSDKDSYGNPDHHARTGR
jgi:CDP-glucose 4,6-dehydratase